MPFAGRRATRLQRQRQVDQEFWRTTAVPAIAQRKRTKVNVSRDHATGLRRRLPLVSKRDGIDTQGGQIPEPNRLRAIECPVAT